MPLLRLPSAHVIQTLILNCFTSFVYSTGAGTVTKLLQPFVREDALRSEGLVLSPVLSHRISYKI